VIDKQIGEKGGKGKQKKRTNNNDGKGAVRTSSSSFSVTMLDARSSNRQLI
jgi:hypothetical protein